MANTSFFGPIVTRTILRPSLYCRQLRLSEQRPSLEYIPHSPILPDADTLSRRRHAFGRGTGCRFRHDHSLRPSEFDTDFETMQAASAGFTSASGRARSRDPFVVVVSTRN